MKEDIQIEIASVEQAEEVIERMADDWIAEARKEQPDDLADFVLKSAIVTMEKNFDIYAKSGAKEQAACSKGCAWCCIIKVTVTEPEARLIAEQLRNVEDRDVRRKFIKHLRGKADRVAGLNDRQHLAKAMLCGFCKGSDGSCRIYNVRPLPCRAWHSLDVEACKSAFGMLDGKTPQSADRTLLGSMCYSAYSRALEKLGISTERTELHAAVLKELKR